MKRFAIAPLVVALAATVSFAGPMVELTKVCPELRYVGRDATFEIKVTNKGDAPAANVVVTDIIPSSLSFLNADNNGTRQGERIQWRVDLLEPGATKTFKSTFRCNEIGKFKNKASVSYCVEMEDECELEVRGIPAILLECVDDPDPMEIDGNVTYTITVTNQGSAVGTGITIACKLPAEEDYVSSDGPTKATADGKKVTFAALPSLAPKAKAVYKVTIKGVSEGDARFEVELNSDQITSPVMETESTHIYK